MDPWQIEKELASKLGLVTWSDAPSALVLTGTAVVSDDGEGEFLPRSPKGADAFLLPYALVRFDRATRDPEMRGRFKEAVFVVTVVAGGSGIAGAAGTDATHDSHGIASMVGGTRDPSSGQGKSTGRGVDEVVNRLMEGLGTRGELIADTHGMQGELGELGPPIPVDGVQVVARQFEVTVYDATIARHYHAVSRFAATGGSGQVVMSWTLPPARHDLLRVILRRAAGATPPATVTDGTNVTLSSDLATSKTDVVAAGTYSYSLFAAYDETHVPVSTEERYSAAVSRSSVTAS